MRRWLIAVIGLYVAAVSATGFDNVDPQLLDVFTGHMVLVLVGLLTLFYAVMATATVLVVTFVTTFTCRLANPAFDSRASTPVVHVLLCIALISRLPAVAASQYLHTPWGALFLVIPAVAAFVAIHRIPALHGARGLAALTPFLVYVLGDAALIVWGAA